MIDSSYVQVDLLPIQSKCNGGKIKLERSIFEQNTETVAD